MSPKKPNINKNKVREGRLIAITPSPPHPAMSAVNFYFLSFTHASTKKNQDTSERQAEVVAGSGTW